MADPVGTRPRALVTGASRGIGRAIAIRMAADAYDVAAVARSREALARVTHDALPGTVHGCPCDLTDRAQTCALIDAQASTGPLRALVHCAAVITRGRLEDLDAESLTAAFDQNVTSAYRLTRGLLPLLGEGSTVVFLNSSQARGTTAGFSHYGATKHALTGVADALRAEVNERGIRVTTLYAGRVATPAQEQLYSDAGAAYRPELLLQPESVADVVAHVCALPATAEVTDLSIRPAIKSY